MPCLYRTTGALLLSLPLLVSAAEADCVPQTQIDVSLIDRQIVLVGESHGTNEIPAFTAGLVCSLLRAGRSVILGIEHSGEEQAALNRYLDSAGGPVDRQALMQSSANWRSYADGRGSVAMLAMIESMRRLRKQGQRVGVLAIQRNDNLSVPTEAADRVPLKPADTALYGRMNDADMANAVLYAAILYRRYVIVVLAGSAHTSTVPSSGDDPMFVRRMPMGRIIAAESPVFSIGIESGGGEHAATSSAGSKLHPMTPGPLYEEGTQVDARVRFDRLSASPPARDAVGD